MIIDWIIFHSFVFMFPFDRRRRFVVWLVTPIQCRQQSLFSMTFCVYLSLNWIRTHLISMEQRFSRKRTTPPFTLICGHSSMGFVWVASFGFVSRRIWFAADTSSKYHLYFNCSCVDVFLSLTANTRISQSVWTCGNGGCGTVDVYGEGTLSYDVKHMRRCDETIRIEGKIYDC